jgi:hypothetical protein
MLKATCQTHDIQTLAEIVPCNGGHKFVFQNGLAATLPADHPDHDIILRNAQWGLEQRKPVGLVVDGDGRISNLNYTYQASVSYVKDDADDPNRLMVAFWGFSAVCYLTRDHPEFERIRLTLAEAIASGNPVCFATHSWPVEGETEIWNKILDARPSQWPEPAPTAGAGSAGANGAPGDADRVKEHYRGTGNEE